MDLLRGDTNNNNSKGVSYISGFLMLVGLAILGLVAGSFIGIGILVAKTGGSVTEVAKALKNPAYADTIKLIQVISVVVSMFIPTWLVASILNRKPFHLIGFRKNIRFSQIGLVLLIIFLSLFIAAAFGVLNKEIVESLGWTGWSERLEKDYNEQVAIMLDVKSIGGYLLSLFIMAFLPALCEEVLFRGGLQNFLTRAIKNPWVSILIVSILFSLVHFSVYGFLVRMFLGIVLGLIYHYTQNIWLNIAAHFFNNALAVSSVYFFVRQGKNMEEAMSKDIAAAYWGFLAIPILVFLFMVLKKNATGSDQLTSSTHGI